MNKSAALAVAPLVLLQLLLLAAASPIRYDQRQDGDSNIDARLSNFFVVLAPSNTAQLSNTGVSLLDLASKAVPLRLRPQASADGLKQREEADQDQPGQEVKEGKTGRSVQQAPLAAVAIPAAILQSPLAKLHPEVQALAVEEVLIARSPVVALKTPAGPTPIGAPAVPMLVAIPVPEVAPERPAAPPALLPMHPQGDKQAPAAAEAAAVIASEAIAAPAAAVIIPEINAAPVADAAPVTVPEVAAEAVPEAAATLSEAIAAAEAVVAAADEVAAPAPAIAEVLAAAADVAAPVENAPPAVETNQVELPKVHLIGTGIEECGPERIRNQEGICVDEPKQY